MIEHNHVPDLSAVVALAAGVLLSLGFVAVFVTSPQVVPRWCAAHGGCPVVPQFPHAV